MSQHFILKIFDMGGIYGSLVHYTSAIAFCGSAFLIFFYLWRKGRLDMDEEPKFKMLEQKESDDNGSS